MFYRAVCFLELFGVVLRKFAIVIIFCTVTVCAHCELNISSNDAITYSDDNSEIFASGDARVTYDDFTLQADEITFNKLTSSASAKGNVKVEVDDVFITSDAMVYDSASGTLYANDNKAKVGEYFLSADSVEATSKIQTGTNVNAYYRDPRLLLVPSLHAKRARVINSDVLQAKDVSFKINRIPVFKLPYAEIGLNDSPFQIEPCPGGNSKDGVFVKNNIYFGVRKWLKIGGLLDFYTKRGVLFGPAAKVNYNEGDNIILSDVQFGFIRDGVERRGGNRGCRREIPKDRHFLEFKYKQHYKDRLDITSNISWLSDRDVEHDFRKKLFDDSFQPNSFVEVDYRDENYIASAFTKFDPNRFGGYTSRLPEIRFDYLPTRLLDTDLIQNWHVSVSRIEDRKKRDRNHGNAYELTKVTRGDIYYGLSLPISHEDIFTFKPIAGVMVVGYDYDLERTNGMHWDERDSRSKALTQIGFDAELNFSGYSDYSNEFLGINGLKHTITPIIQYRVIPSGNVVNENLKVDKYIFNIDLPPIDLDDMRNIDEIREQNMIRVGVKNRLYTKSGSYFPRKLLAFDLYQDVLFHRNEESYRGLVWKQKRFENTHVIFGFYPSELISFDVYSQIDPNGLILKNLKTKTSFHEGDIWSISFITRYEKLEKRAKEQYDVVFKMALSSKTSFSLIERFDAIDNRHSKQGIMISTIFGEFWNADFGVTFRQKGSRKGRVEFNWNLRAVSF